MKVLVSTKKTQGQRENDFCFCKEGEIVYFGFECDGEEVDGNCGCKRALCGCDSLAATTTMKIVDKNMGLVDLAHTIEDSLKKGGWINDKNKERMKEHVGQMVAELEDICHKFVVGDVLERRGNDMIRRI